MSGKFALFCLVALVAAFAFVEVAQAQYYGYGYEYPGYYGGYGAYGYGYPYGGYGYGGYGYVSFTFKNSKIFRRNIRFTIVYLGITSKINFLKFNNFLKVILKLFRGNF